MKTLQLAPGADLLAVLEALYAPEADPVEWARAVVGAVHRVLVGVRSIGLGVLAHENDYRGRRRCSVRPPTPRLTR